VGATSVLMAPMAFVQEPIRWLRAITKYRARTSGAPNFAYDLCAAKITAAEREGLDLSSWTVAFNGSEPVRHDTLDRFVAAFEPVGFRRTSFYPCYGLAEATLLVSGPVRSTPPLVRSFKAADLEQRLAIPSSNGDEGGRFLVGCGKTWLNQIIAIVDPETSKRCSDGQIGEIWISGPNVAQGYWNREEVTAATFGAHISDSGDGPFLRTGDLGFFHDGDLFISGRIKDLIIIRGRNHFPQDIERTVESCHPILRPGCVAAFSIDVDGEERLVVVQEVKRSFKEADLGDVIAVIREAVMRNHELATHAIVLIKPGHIAKTSSGKIQRHACRQRFLAEALDPLQVSVFSEMVTEEETAPSSGMDLLRQTLVMLDPETRRALMVSHLREQTGEVAPQGSITAADTTVGDLDASARARLCRVLERDLGVPVPEALLLSAQNLDALASRLIDLVFDGASGPRSTHEGATLEIGNTSHR
jgi:acyl-CoA synthetase (AMP-forming)/AMP-acid ligase II